MSGTIDKANYFQKLNALLEYAEQLSEGHYLHIANELKELFALLKGVKDTEHYSHLERSYGHYLRRQTQDDIHRHILKYTCKKCGRVVADLQTHQNRVICKNFSKEKKFSAETQIPMAILTATHYANTIHKWWRQQRTKLQNASASA